MKHLKLPVLLLVMTMMAPSLQAADDYTDRPEFEAFVDDMARKHAFDADRVRQWLGRPVISHASSS